MLDILLKRRTSRKFDSTKEVEKEKIEEIVRAGLVAPSGKNQQLAEIFVITNKEFRDRLAELNAKVWGVGTAVDPFYGAPVILLVASKPSPFADLDGAAIIQNMLLEATNQGLGTCWIHRAKEELQLEETKALFASRGLDISDYVGVDHIALGYSLAPTPAEKVIRPGRVHYID